MNKFQFCLFVGYIILFFSVQSAFSQSNHLRNKDFLKQISQKEKSVFLYVENLDSVPGFYETAVKHFKNLGFWKLSSNIQQSDMVIVITGFKIKMWGDSRFECYPKVFDNKMNLLYRGEYTWKRNTNFDPFEACFNKTIKSVINDLPNNLKKAKMFVPCHNEDAYINDSKYIENYNMALEAIESGQNKKAVEYLSMCIKKHPNIPELFQMRGILFLNQDIPKKAMSDFAQVLKYDPLNVDIDRLWQEARLQRSERDEKTINRCLAISSFSSAITTSLNNNSNKISTNEYLKSSVNPDNKRNITGKMQKKECSSCHGSGINQTATSVAYLVEGYHYCDVCKKTVPDSHGYHGKCPSCNGKGYNLKFVYE